jgi:hypothetical protein
MYGWAHRLANTSELQASGPSRGNEALAYYLLLLQQLAVDALGGGASKNMCHHTHMYLELHAVAMALQLVAAPRCAVQLATGNNKTAMGISQPQPQPQLPTA